jgi:hypothetical protein
MNQLNSKATHIHGSPIVAALRANLTYAGKVKDCTRVWLKDGSLHLVTGYEYAGHPTPCFETVVGYWEIPEGFSYLSKECVEVITRPSYVEFN